VLLGVVFQFEPISGDLHLSDRRRRPRCSGRLNQCSNAAERLVGPSPRAWAGVHALRVEVPTTPSCGRPCCRQPSSTFLSRDLVSWSSLPHRDPHGPASSSIQPRLGPGNHLAQARLPCRPSSRARAASFCRALSSDPAGRLCVLQNRDFGALRRTSSSWLLTFDAQVPKIVRLIKAD